MNIRLSVDIGGTFTDVVLAKNADLTTIKVLTTPVDPALGVMQGIADVLHRGGVKAEDVSVVLHGTTLATNALIERRGAATALLTTAGHRDVLEMAFENRFEQYDVNIDRPQPLVPRYWRIGIEERIAADGEVLIALDEPAVGEAVDRLVDDGVEALAIGFLHAYASPDHEQQAAAIVAQRHPTLSLSLSSAVCPEIREYERLSTTVANAYVKPLMSRYLASLQAQLRDSGFSCQVMMMTSGGGLTTLDTAAQYPIRLVESGPAGGAMLAADMAIRHGLDRVLSFDMGGTTAKICLIDDAEPQHSRAFEVDRSYRFKKGSGLPVRIPVIEMVEIGAGGGSIAKLDSMRRIQVGPASAGAEPGPACYGKGGVEATVTDADVVLGKLPADYFAGGSLRLAVDAAQDVIMQAVAQPLSLSPLEGAQAIAEIVEENMASAARAHAAEWGKGLHDRCLIAFGGAAPLHAARLANKLKIRRLLIPAGAGVGSAIGFLLAPISFEVVRSQYMRLDAVRIDTIRGLFADMRQEASAVLAGAGVGVNTRENIGVDKVDADQVNADKKVVEKREAFMRYIGQGYEVAVDIAALDDLGESSLRLAFEAAYQALYGRIIPGMDIEILSWTLALRAPAPASQIAASMATRTESAPMGKVVMHGAPGTENVPVFLRESLPVKTTGPLLVVEQQTTTVVPAGVDLEVLHDGTLSLVFAD